MIVPFSIRKTIDALNWNQFCDARLMLEEELVRDFYTNLTTSDANEFHVHKKKVPFTFKSINDFFNLPDVEEDEYFTMMTNISWDFLQKILNVITNWGSKWIIKKYNSHYCRMEYLNPVANLHAYLTQFHHLDGTNAFVVCNYEKKGSINVGRIVLKQIQDYARKKVRSAYFPSLTTSLCLRAQIKSKANLKSYYVQEFDESSTKSEPEGDSVNEIEEAETEEEPNSSKPRVEPNVTELVEPSVNPELTIPIPTSSSTLKK
ncbi:hypothetical protein PVK06_043276 [Gossypium arboreum]|uniref:Putative plant transposon protein domain-containing protein n=1 Tax=Gossypium arboreum TaxID=29729 RepID=A0ABR0MN22_GOSAR|nr:hypothetical protein PVK06_043276 [Gossypium arboreum]